MPIGRDLLDLPFAEIVRNLAVAIADGQAALDRNAVETLKALAALEIDVVGDLIEIVEPDIRTVEVNVADGGGSHKETIQVTGARVRPSGISPVRMTMVQAGLLPTFYQFTEATVEVKLSITMREDRDVATQGGTAAPKPFLGLGGSRAYAGTVDYRTQGKYSYQASGASVLRATMRPVPMPSRLEPSVTVVDTISQPATVTRSPR